MVGNRPWPRALWGGGDPKCSISLESSCSISLRPCRPEGDVPIPTGTPHLCSSGLRGGKQRKPPHLRTSLWLCRRLKAAFQPILGRELLLGGQCSLDRLSHLGRIWNNSRFETLQDLPVPANEE